MKKYILPLILLVACSSPSANEPEPPAFESYRIGSWEVFAEKQAKWVGVQAAAKATDSTHFTQPEGYGLFIEAQPELPPNAIYPGENHFVLALHDSTITEVPQGENSYYDIITPFPESQGSLIGISMENGFIKILRGYAYECESPYELESDEIIEFWNNFSGEKRTFTFNVDGYLDTIHNVACD